MLKTTISETSVHVQRHEGGVAAICTAMWNLNKAGPCTQPHVPVTPMVSTPFLHYSYLCSRYQNTHCEPHLLEEVVLTDVSTGYTNQLLCRAD